MNTITSSFLLIIGYICMTSCGPVVDVQEVVTANNLFSSSVYKEVLLENVDKNFIASPFCAQTVLALTLSGAKNKTAEELRSALRLPEDQTRVENIFKVLLPTIISNKNYVLNSANKIYVDDGFFINENYKKIASDSYKSAIEEIKFTPQEKAAATINKWVEEQTNNKIKNLVDPTVLDDRTRLVLVNALHFKASWSSPFVDRFTTKANFYKTEKDVVEVDTMRSKGTYNYYESPEISAKFLELPFEGEEASLVIVLPIKTEGVKSIESQLDKAFAQPKFTREYVNITLPKFKIDTKINFRQILENLGVTTAFKSGEADLSGMSGKPGDLFISEVLQKAFVDVNEKGAEAAAAAYVEVEDRIFGGKTDPKQFRADHPFIFYIKFKGIILFVGKIVHPSY